MLVSDPSYAGGINITHNSQEEGRITCIFVSCHQRNLARIVNHSFFFTMTSLPVLTQVWSDVVFNKLCQNKTNFEDVHEKYMSAAGLHLKHLKTVKILYQFQNSIIILPAILSPSRLHIVFEARPVYTVYTKIRLHLLVRKLARRQFETDTVKVLSVFLSDNI